MTNARRVNVLSGAIVAALVLFVPQFGPAPSNGRAIDRVNTDWWRGMQHRVAASEYQPRQSRAGLQAANRAHNLRTYFDGSGIRVHDRTAPATTELIGLSLIGIGRHDTMRPVKPGTVHRVDGRVEIRRRGITEWYENSAQGLEQGFTIESRAAGQTALILDLAVDHARAELRGDTIDLVTHAGRRLHYGKLLAEDSRGLVLASRLDVPAPDRVRLVIEDTGATYPLLIDPLLTGQPDARLESNQSDPEGHGTPEFGFSVSSAGDVNGDGFGDVIVGAPGWDGGQQGEGAAFIFLGSAGGIVGADPSTAHAHLESDQALAAFGVSVSGAGDVNHDGFDDVIVGANFYDSTLPGTQLAVTGAAFVFLGSAAGIQGRDPATAHARVFANKHESEFGEVVSSAGDVNSDGFDDVIVCAPHQGHDFPPDTGIPPNQQSGEHGAVFVFHGGPQGIVSGTGMAVADAVLLPYQLGPVDPVVLAQFSSVAAAGDVNRDGFDDILISGDDAFLFVGSAAGVVGRDPTAARSRVRRDVLTQGFKVAGAGDVNGDGFNDVLLGSPTRESVQFSSDQKGAAFVFLGGPGGIVGGHVADAHATVIGTVLAEWVGHSIDGAGDVDRDGFSDIVVAARVYPGSLANEGVAYLFRGSAQGITARSLLDADARLVAPQAGAAVKGTSAFSVAGAGDINKDGFDDVITGKGFFDAGQADEGAAFIYLGGPFPAVTPTVSLLTLTAMPSSVPGGITAIGTITLTGSAPIGGVLVALSDNSSIVVTDPNVTVPEGATSTTFTIATSAVAATTAVTLTATAGSVNKTASLTVTPADNGGGVPAFRSPASNAPDGGGDGNGFESTAINAHGDDSLVATDTNSGTGTGTSCTSSGKDRHRFYDYGVVIPNGATIAGIEVRVDARADSTSGTPRLCVQLSGDGGTTWTTAKAAATLGTSLATFTLGGTSDTWGRAWSAANLSNTSFRVRVISVASSTARDFFLEWVAVRAHLSTTQAPNPPPATATVTVTATGRSGERVTSSPAGINVPVGSTQSATFTTGTQITLTVSNGREAVWSGACSSGGNRRRTCTFTASGNAAVNVNVQ